MALLDQLRILGQNLLSLGARRLAALAAAGLAVFAVTGLVGYYLSRPDLETLYVGLDRQDVSRIGSTLKDAGIPFDVNAEGTAVLVRYGHTARARVLLAEKGLPQSTKSGYELFDRMGSLGLTSFMQQVTRIRAIEGELARTIQTINGVKAARVHIVLGDEGSFRRARQPPSASVVIRSEGADPHRTAQSVRHLVAAAVPEMTAERVTVLGADGALLASGSENTDTAPGGKLALEKQIARQLEENIRKTLAPYLTLRNFQVSVVASANIDRRQVNETIFNPESRVERSVRVTRENQTAENANVRAPTTVAQNLPQDRTPGGDRRSTNEQAQKREELTNYEISSKTIVTAMAGYTIEGLAVALLVNKAALVGPGGKALEEADLKARVAQIESLASSAAGLDKKRGDRIDLVTVEFAEQPGDLQPAAGEAFREVLQKQAGTMINAAVALVIAVLLIVAGLKPALRMLQSAPATLPAGEALLARPPVGKPERLEAAPSAAALPSPAEGSFMARPAEAPATPQERLRQLVAADADRAAAILKGWIAEGKKP